MYKFIVKNYPEQGDLARISNASHQISESVDVK